MPRGEHPNSRSNLRPWQKGDPSPNPKGRPKGTSISTRLRELVEGDEGKVADAIAKACIKAALRGDHRFVKEIMDRLEGKVKDKVEVDGDIRVIEQRFVAAKPPEESDADSGGNPS